MQPQGSNKPSGGNEHVGPTHGSGRRDGSLELELATLTRERYDRLREIIGDIGSALVAFSGGVDSTLLLKVAVDVLGPERSVALLDVSPSLPAREREDAQALAMLLGARLLVTETGEMDSEAFVRNDEDRCYHCKSLLLDRAGALARAEGLAHVVLGTNADDLSDHRPGHRAALEHGARHPLMEAGLTKPEIRELGCALGLPNWDKAEMACLASRLPYGLRITRERLGQVEAMEDALWNLGFGQVRVRHHGELARIEVEPEAVARLFVRKHREALLGLGHDLGFKHVTVDLKGYRRGAMNEGRNLPRGSDEQAGEAGDHTGRKHGR